MNQSATLVQTWFSDARFRGGERLPPERVLAETLQLSRAALRKGLALLEAEGLLVRHVGRGTFVRGEAADGKVAQLAAFHGPVDCSPRQLLSARLSFEPQLARLAAREGTGSDLDRVRQAGAAVVEAGDWSSFDEADDAFHRAIALATGNPVLVHLFDQITLARRAMNWGRLRERSGDGLSTRAARDEHAEIVTGILARDAEAAEAALSHHLMVEAATILGVLV